MIRHRPTILCALTALAIYGIVAISAPAAECEKESGKTHFAFCFNEPSTLVEGTFKLHISDDPTAPTKEFILRGAEVEIRCPEILLQLSATIAAGKTVSLGARLGGMVAHFIGCKLPSPAHCSVENELILTRTLDGVPPSSSEEDNLTLFLPETGDEFTILKIDSSGGTCLIAGIQKVVSLNGREGEGPLCKSPDAETTTTLHLTECTGGTGLAHLKFAGKEVEVKGNCSVLLEGQKTKWAVILGK
jgi:hypothetical protein